VKYPAPVASGMAATGALGQPDLTSSGCGVSATTLCEPVGMAFDPSGNLWVADAGNSRVVRFPASPATGAAATIALGQPDLTSSVPNNGGLSASTLDTPNAVMVDNSGNVWVADSNNNRVLKYQAPFATGMAASLALGQPDLVSNSSNQGGAPAAATLSFPAGLQVTDINHLLVGDENNNRSLVYGTTFTTGMNASVVLGQTAFTANSSNQGGSASATTQSAPWGAGPSWIALLVLAALMGAWFLWQRKKRRGQGAIAA